MPLYHIGIMGVPPPQVLEALKDMVLKSIGEFGLAKEVAFTLADQPFEPPQDHAAVVVYFGSPGAPDQSAKLKQLMREGVAVLPVVSSYAKVADEVPECLRPINAIDLNAADANQDRIAVALLEVLGLLPRQRRIFLSYRRDESREVALQLFESLSARHFDVFVDTHAVPFGVDFQEHLWHRLSDCDALVMLDTLTYFESKWTRMEFGKALAKDLIPVRLAWPGVPRNPRSISGLSMQFTDDDFVDAAKSQLTDATLERCGLLIEQARSKGLALRTVNMVSTLTLNAQRIGGQFLGLGPRRTVLIEVPDKHRVLFFPSVGVPTAEHLHLVSALEEEVDSRAVVYDECGIAPGWQNHLDWIGTQVKAARWLKLGKARWDLSTWVDDVA